MNIPASANPNLIRLLIIGAAFLTVTLVLIILQPSAARVATAPQDEAPLAVDSQGDVVTRAETELLALTPEPSSEPEDMIADVLAQLQTPAATAPTPAPAATDAPLEQMTASVLASLSGAAPKTDAPASMSDLVTQALGQGQSDAYIEALLNEAASSGAIAVPASLQTEAGRVDTKTLLAELVRKSDPEAANLAPEPIASGDGVEVRVVQRAGETRQYNFYTVQRGDSLGAIAQRFYGDAALYTVIFEANKQFLGGPNRIRVGQRLSIPNTFQDS